MSPRFVLSHAATLCLLVLAACAGPARLSERDVAVAEDELRAHDMEWAAASAAGDVEGMVAFYADDVVFLAPGFPVLRGVEAVTAAMSDMHAAPGFSLTWEPGSVTVAPSGDMAWVYGTYEMAMPSESGELTHDHGKYMEVWEREGAGKWRCVADMIHSDGEGHTEASEAKP